jgi:hypothetical protein
MASRSPDEAPHLAVVEGVQCLECGTVYGKPLVGGTVQENPGCPDCGYVGWTSTSPAAFTEARPQTRFDGDQRQFRSG